MFERLANAITGQREALTARLARVFAAQPALLEAPEPRALAASVLEAMRRADPKATPEEGLALWSAADRAHHQGESSLLRVRAMLIAFQDFKYEVADELSGALRDDYLRYECPTLERWLRSLGQHIVARLHEEGLSAFQGELGAAQDELLTALQSLDRKEAMLQALIHVDGPIFSLLADEEWRVLHFSKAGETLFGYTQDEVRHQHAIEFLVSDLSRASLRDEIARAFVADGFWRGNVFVVARGGRTLETFLTAQAFKDSRGQLFGYLVLGLDVTPWRELQEQALKQSSALQKTVEERSRDLEEAQGLYRHLVEDISEGYFITHEGRFIFTNRAFAAITGYTSEELGGMEFLDLVVKRSESGARRWWIDVMMGQHERPTEFLIQRRDGSRAAVEFHANPLALRGEPHVIGVIRDITHAKKLERNLRGLVETLEKRVAERTSALETSLHELRSAQEQLIRAEKLASLGRIASQVAHEINNPLQALLFKAQHIAVKADDPEKVRTGAHDIGDYVERIAEIVRRLHEYAATAKDEALTHEHEGGTDV